MSSKNLIRIENTKYPIFVGMGILDQIYKLLPLKSYSQIAVLSDENVASHWLSTLNQKTDLKIKSIIIPSGEQAKSIRQAEKVWMAMLKLGLDRRSLLINLGGGVIGDLGGFNAATFMRGINFLQIPTSLLAMVDASIGGKTGINVGEVKNSVGVFCDPIAVIIDVDTLDTLPNREFISGFAEIIKHGVIADRKYFDLVSSKRPEEFSKKELMELIVGSIKIKLGILKQDYEEKGLRKVLNFGHTIGHAIETLSLKSNNPLLHGEAIAIGMVAESKLAQLLGLLPNEEFITIEKTISYFGFATRINNIQVKDIMRLIILDKKNKSGKVLWSLPKRIGLVKYDFEASKKLIIKAINYIKI